MPTAEQRKPSLLIKGTLVMWNDLKGFGFVRPDEADGEQDDHFIHISAFKKGMVRRPEVGDAVRFRPADATDRKRAAFAVVEGVEQEPPAAEPKRFTLTPKPRSWTTNLLILIPLALSSYLLWRAKNPIPFFSYGVFSLLTIIIYGADKTHAAIRTWRVPEIYLHILELMGGWPGALIAESALRHKTRKSLYKAVLHAIIAVHLAGWAAYLYWAYRHGGL
jgi:uncharacterized membrane protein YsdA (DUF1294 family)/cold shock CspA family protein